MTKGRQQLSTVALGLSLLFGFVGPAAARGSSCVEGNGNCLILRGDHPAAQFVTFSMVLTVVAALLAVMGFWAMHLRRHPGEKVPFTAWTLFDLVRQPGWPLEKKLALGGLLTAIGSFLLGQVLMRVFGTYV